MTTRNIWDPRDDGKYLTRLQASRIYALVQSSSASISLVSSLCILCMIYRSHHGLSTTLNRLIFGLCVADFLSSFALSLSTLPIPQDEIDNIWNARGTTTTCEMVGFVTFIGTSAAPLYNSSLCLYYLSVIKYNLPDQFINNKIEPFLHCISVGFPILGALTVLSIGAFNPMLTVCWIAPVPWGCDMDDTGTRPCLRGEHYLIPFIIFSIVPLIILPCIICVSMCSMYFTVREYEKRMQEFSIGWRRSSTVSVDVIVRTPERRERGGEELRAITTTGEERDVSTSNNDDNGGSGGADHDDNHSEGQGRGEESTSNRSEAGQRRNSFIAQIKRLRGRCSMSNNSSQNHTTPDPFERFNNSHNRNRESRTILYKAIAYSSAYFATYIFYIILYVLAFLGIEPGFVLEVVFRVFTPLQGFWNFLIFIIPRVNYTMRSHSSTDTNITWRQALVMALMSRGPLLSVRNSTRRNSFSLRRSRRNSALHLPHTV